MFDVPIEVLSLTIICAFCFYVAVSILIKKGERICFNQIKMVVSNQYSYLPFFRPYRGTPLSLCLLKKGLIPEIINNNTDLLNHIHLEGLLRKAIAYHEISLNHGQEVRIEGRRICDMNQEEILLVYRAVFLADLRIKDVFSYRYLLALSVSKKMALLMQKSSSCKFLHRSYCKRVYFHSTNHEVKLPNFC